MHLAPPPNKNFGLQFLVIWANNPIPRDQVEASTWGGLELAPKK